MAWIKVTDPLGHPVWLCVEQLIRVRPFLAGIDSLAAAPDVGTAHKTSDTAPAPSLAKSIVDLVAGQQAVRETQDEVIERIRNAGKDDGRDKAAGA
jgi:hypothetical protein